MPQLPSFKVLLPAVLVVGALIMSPSTLAMPGQAQAIAAQPAAAAQPQDREPGAAPKARHKSTAARANTATITGKVFYNDRRTDGLFAARMDKNGDPGTRCSVSGQRDNNGGACSLNWLAGKYMVVDVIERDMTVSPKVEDPACKTEEVLTSATVDSEGSFTATFGTNDPCTNDLLPKSAIELRVRLRFCNSSYCFSINRSTGNPYTLSHPRATAANPMTVRAGANITVAALDFNTAADASKPNNDSIAANYYASIVDTVLALHKDIAIPFYKDAFGEVQYIFPSTESSTATALSPSKVAISIYESQPASANRAFTWIGGRIPAHEYGHVLMQRAWDGSYGFNGIGISAGSSEIAPSQQIAFKEGWAEFVPRAVFPLTRGCGLSGYDVNGALTGCTAITQALNALQQRRRDQLDLIEHLQGAGLQAAQGQLANIEADIAEQEELLDECKTASTMTNLPGALGEGATWRDNVTKALCDWHDATNDNDSRLAGDGDQNVSDDIYSMWFNLRRMKLDAALYGGKYTNPGLWFCDYVNYYLKVRNSAAEVGATSHATTKPRSTT